MALGLVVFSLLWCCLFLLLGLGFGFGGCGFFIGYYLVICDGFCLVMFVGRLQCLLGSVGATWGLCRVVCFGRVSVFVRFVNCLVGLIIGMSGFVGVGGGVSFFHFVSFVSFSWG